jgi:hypothetical protein
MWQLASLPVRQRVMAPLLQPVPNISGISQPRSFHSWLHHPEALQPPMWAACAQATRLGPEISGIPKPCPFHCWLRDPQAAQPPSVQCVATANTNGPGTHHVQHLVVLGWILAYFGATLAACELAARLQLGRRSLAVHSHVHSCAAYTTLKLCRHPSGQHVATGNTKAFQSHIHFTAGYPQADQLTHESVATGNIKGPDTPNSRIRQHSRICKCGG